MPRFSIATARKREIVDITDRVAEFVAGTGLGNGLVHLFVLHTTAALTTADLDPGTDLDMLDAFEAMIPRHANSAPPPNGSGNTKAHMRIRYRHPHNPAHVPDHILSSLIGASLLVPVERGKLVLGTWQRIILVELDGPRERTIVCTFLPEGITPKV